MSIVAGNAPSSGAPTSKIPARGSSQLQLHHDDSQDEGDEDYVPDRSGDSSGRGRGAAPGDDGVSGTCGESVKTVTGTACERDSAEKEATSDDEDADDMSMEDSEDSEDDLTADDGPGL